MRDHILSETSNIKAAHQAVSYLLSRPIAHQPGLGMIYGAPGLGKTQFSQRTCIRNDYVYLSAHKADTAKSFISSLATALMLRYYPREYTALHGSASTLFNRVLEIINANSNASHLPVIFIDEVDNIIHYPHENIVGMLRDIVDNTAAVVMLIGMQDLRNKIVKLNAHYYNRVVYFCEFSPLTLADIRLITRDLCEITLAEDLVRSIHESSKGDARKVIKYLRHYEEIAAANHLSSLDSTTARKLILKEAI